MKFSVLMPVYAGDDPAFFAQALASVFDQSRTPDEVVVVMDGPLSQAHHEVLDQFSSSVPRIRPIPLSGHRGLSGALNVGLEAASNEWVGRMDSDDICRPDRFEMQLSYLESRPDVGLLGSWITEFEEDPDLVTGVRRVPERDREIKRFARWRCPFNHMTVFYRRDEVLAAGGYRDLGPTNPSGFGDDYELWARLLVSGVRAANIPEPLVAARTGVDFFERRRRGLNYLRSEFRLLSDLRRSGLFGPLVCVGHLCGRSMARLLPAQALRRLYGVFRY